MSTQEKMIQRTLNHSSRLREAMQRTPIDLTQTSLNIQKQLERTLERARRQERERDRDR